MAHVRITRLQGGGTIELDSAPIDLVGLIALKQLRRYFPQATEQERQVHALAEEGGEFLGAHRRWAGMARRLGPFEDVESELADVLITAYVTAAAFGVEVHARNIAREENPTRAVGDVFVRASRVLETYLGQGWGTTDPYTTDPGQIEVLLEQLVASAWRCAGLLRIDLDAAWRAKAEKVFTRGWRDSPEPAAVRNVAPEEES